MATLTPRYQPSVGTPLGGQRITPPTITDGESFRVLGRLVGMVGQGAQLGERLAEERADTEFKEADLKDRQAKNESLFNSENGFFTLQGNDAVVAAESVKAKLRESRAEAVKGLSPRARKRFDEVADIREAETFREIDVYTGKQKRIYEDGVSLAREGTLKEDFIRYWTTDPDRAGASLGAARKERMDRLDRNGFGAETIQRETDLLTGEAYEQLATTLLDEDPGKAEMIVEGYGHLMNPLRRAQLKEAAETEATKREANRFADGGSLGGEYSFTGAASPAEKAIVTQLRQVDLPDVAVAAVAGVFHHESGGLRTDARNPRDGKDGSDSIGYGQWNSTRAAELKSYAASRGRDWRDPDIQTRFFLMEIQRDHPAAWKKLQSAKTIEEAVAAMNDYEKPKGWSLGGDPTKVDGWENRVKQAKRIAGEQRSISEGVKPGDSLEVALAKADKAAGGDPKKQETYRAAATLAVRKYEAIEADNQRRAFDAIQPYIQPDSKITSWTQIPSKEWRNLSPQQQTSIKEHFARQATSADPEVWAGLMDLSLSDPKAFKDANIDVLLPKLGVEQYRYWKKRQEDAIRGKGDFETENLSLEQVNRVAALTIPNEIAKDKKRAAEYRTAFFRTASDLAARNDGKPLTDRQLEEIGSRLALDQATGRGAWFGQGPEGKRPLWEYGVVDGKARGYDDIPPASRTRIISDYRKKYGGRDPTKEQVVEAYRTLRSLGELE